ncbi:beta-glucosidase BglX [Aliikangiella marina]|uniref:beta-glucosidase n=2 Tax=Aliikangiella marina TaxID=1712262 RepID=A0A545T3C3_9GAMM|nr:beta-glucosidase BglX [Aliikangiella marina]
MTLAEKIGQLNMQDGTGEHAVAYLAMSIRNGSLGSILNQTNVETINELQRIALEESRLKIPLLIARDVIHGFKTVMPIPLGQAASWNPELVKQGAVIAATEAASTGINWTFAPMVDISRDPRWGRIAESLGEDPYLAGELGAAMVKGFQGENLSDKNSIAACVKHFVGYGAAEGGRDYSATNIPDNEMHNVYLRPFKAAVDAGAETLMASFSDIDGVPATANDYLLTDVLRDEWKFDGTVVSDWNAVGELEDHGIADGEKSAALLASVAGIDMEMAGKCFSGHLEDLVTSGQLSTEKLDQMVANVLRTKLRLGLFDNPYTNPSDYPGIAYPEALKVAKESAVQSLVLLKNDNDTLPLSNNIASLAVIGPLADAPYEQLGTWIFDGDATFSVTALNGIQSFVGDSTKVNYCKALANSRSESTEAFDDALQVAKASDAVILCLGEESILSGEAHCRADIDLPGAQVELVKTLHAAGKPIILVVLAGRSITLGNVVDYCDAILFAWHPGTMGGAAIADVVFGKVSPSGKLPVTFPSVVGQVPMYYNHKNTGRPPSKEKVILMDEIEEFAPQTSLGMTAFYLDAGYKPLFAFGHGLSYGEFEYSQLQLSASKIAPREELTVTVNLKNTGACQAEEVVQLYTRDLVGSVTRPVKELKGFKRIALGPNEETTVTFKLTASDLAFYNRKGKWGAEPGKFHLWVGGSSLADLCAEFELTE